MKCLLGKWNDHYRSWTRDLGNLLLIKYEDLIHSPENELERIIEFLKKYINVETDNKKNLEKIIVNFISTEIEWVPINSVEVNKDNKESIVDFLETLEEDDDVQNVYSNVM